MTLVAALVILTWGTRWCGVILAIGVPFVLTIGWTRLYLAYTFLAMFSQVGWFQWRGRSALLW
jgi:hypothetical protein